MVTGSSEGLCGWEKRVGDYHDSGGTVFARALGYTKSVSVSQASMRWAEDTEQRVRYGLDG